MEKIKVDYLVTICYKYLQTLTHRGYNDNGSDDDDDDDDDDDADVMIMMVVVMVTMMMKVVVMTVSQNLSSLFLKP